MALEFNEASEYYYATISADWTAAPEHNLVLFACQKTAFTDVALAWKPPG